MFLNPWYGQIGAGPAPEDAATTEGATADQSTGAEAAAVTEKMEDKVSSSSAGPEATKTEGDQIDGSQTASSTLSTVSSASSTAGDQTAVIQKRLKCGWTAHMTQDGRLFYCK